MTNQEIEKLKQMLQSNNEADINLAGNIIYTIEDPSERHKLVDELITPLFQEDWIDVYESKWTEGLTQRKLERWLNKIYHSKDLKEETKRQVVLWGNYELLDELMKEEVKNFINK